jgi:GNAT superfamily N-acetyltransferase
MSVRIRLAKEDSEIQSCYPVMAQLRPQVAPAEFLPRVKRQAAIAGYQIAYVTDGDVKAVAGFRISECLAWGKFLYVDDLISDESERSKGYGGNLFDWLVNHAQEKKCDQFHLDSAVHRFDAHRFYFMKRMVIEGYHFGLKL